MSEIEDELDDSEFEDSVEERAGEQNVEREDIVESVGEENEGVVDRVEEDYESETLETVNCNCLYICRDNYSLCITSCDYLSLCLTQSNV